MNYTYYLAGLRIIELSTYVSTCYAIHVMNNFALNKYANLILNPISNQDLEHSVTSKADYCMSVLAISLAISKCKIITKLYDVRVRGCNYMSRVAEFRQALNIFGKWKRFNTYHQINLLK